MRANAPPCVSASFTAATSDPNGVKPAPARPNQDGVAVPAPGVPKQSQIISAWVQSNPDVKWATAKVEIEKLITAAGLKFVEKSDVQQFSKARSGATGGKQSKVKSAVSGEVSLKKFAALTVNIDPAVLADAIKVIGQVGGIEAATTLGKKWGELCEAIGEE